MFSSLQLLFFSLAGATLFVAGFLVGLWMAQHNTRTIDVPQLVEVPKPYEIERVNPTNPPIKAIPPRNGGTFVMVPDTRSKLEKEDTAALGELLGAVDTTTPGQVINNLDPEI